MARQRLQLDDELVEALAPLLSNPTVYEQLDELVKNRVSAHQDRLNLIAVAALTDPALQVKALLVKGALMECQALVELFTRFSNEP